jgi:DNA-binding response OmpR family regulator
MVRHLAKRILESRGYKVLLAEEALEAIQVSEGYEGKIDLLVTDIILPGPVSSEEFVAQLEAQRPETAVLYMSGYTEDVIVNRGGMMPEVAFIHKPFKPHVLASKVRHVLDTRETA